MELGKKQTSRSVGRNVLYGFSTWMLPLILGFIATPKIVRALGSQDYGIYALVLGFVGYSFNFSFGRAVTKYIAEYYANDKRGKITDLISAAVFINIAVGFVSVLIVCASAGWLVRDVYRIDAQAQEKTVAAFYIAAMIVFFSMQNQIFSSVLQGIHRFDVYSKIFNFNNFALLTGNLLLALGGYGLLSLFVWNASLAFLSCFVFGWAARKLLPEFKINFNFKGDTLKLIVRYSAGVIGYQILSNFLLLFERGLITRESGAEALTFYVVPMALAIYIHSFITSLVIVVFPLASELKNEPEKLFRLYSTATKIVCLFVFFLATTLIVEGDLFLKIWTSKDLGADFAVKTSGLLVIHTITFAFVAIQTISWQMTDGLGYPNYNCYIFVICLIISVFLMLYLPPIFGLEGYALGRMFGYLTIFFSVFYVEKWFFGSVQFNLWTKIFGILTAAALTAAVTERLILGFLSVSWFGFLSASVFGAGAYGLIVWVLGFINEEEKKLFRRILFSPQLNDYEKGI